jgi:hypothetical protein
MPHANLPLPLQGNLKTTCLNLARQEDRYRKKDKLFFHFLIESGTKAGKENKFTLIQTRAGLFIFSRRAAGLRVGPSVRPDRRMKFLFFPRFFLLQPEVRFFSE